ncbi:MAG: exodeoxyribonuclease VII small subunit [Dorea sp.]|nr:exodeoxyribonuclease VII small subunit [Dorea sp.]
MSKNQKDALQGTAEELGNCTLEQVIGRLEQVISDMEEETALEESFRMYHQGMELLRACNDKIDRVEKQILILDEEGGTDEF